MEPIQINEKQVRTNRRAAGENIRMALLSCEPAMLNPDQVSVKIALSSL